MVGPTESTEENRVFTTTLLPETTKQYIQLEVVSSLPQSIEEKKLLNSSSDEMFITTQKKYLHEYTTENEYDHINRTRLKSEILETTTALYDEGYENMSEANLISKIIFGNKNDQDKSFEQLKHLERATGKPRDTILQFISANADTKYNLDKHSSELYDTEYEQNAVNLDEDILLIDDQNDYFTFTDGSNLNYDVATSSANDAESPINSLDTKLLSTLTKDGYQIFFLNDQGVRLIYNSDQTETENHHISPSTNPKSQSTGPSINDEVYHSNDARDDLLIYDVEPESADDSQYSRLSTNELLVKIFSSGYQYHERSVDKGEGNDLIKMHLEFLRKHEQRQADEDSYYYDYETEYDYPDEYYSGIASNTPRSDSNKNHPEHRVRRYRNGRQLEQSQILRRNEQRRYSVTKHGPKDTFISPNKLILEEKNDSVQNLGLSDTVSRLLNSLIAQLNPAKKYSGQSSYSSYIKNSDKIYGAESKQSDSMNILDKEAVNSLSKYAVIRFSPTEKIISNEKDNNTVEKNNITENSNNIIQPSSSEKKLSNLPEQNKITSDYVVVNKNILASLLKFSSDSKPSMYSFLHGDEESQGRISNKYMEIIEKELSAIPQQKTPPNAKAENIITEVYFNQATNSISPAADTIKDLCTGNSYLKKKYMYYTLIFILNQTLALSSFSNFIT